MIRLAATRAAPRVWRVTLVWRGTVLDVVTLAGRGGRLRFSTGERLFVRLMEGGVRVSGGGLSQPALLQPNQFLALPGGHEVAVSEALLEPQVGRLAFIDTTLWHASMIAAALQACLIAALVWAPTARLDPEAGAGLPDRYRRLLLAPGGGAPMRGAPSLSLRGREAVEGEKHSLSRSAAQRAPVRGGKDLTLEQALDEMSRALHVGNHGVELREALGELAQSVARAPELGAGVGGLSPRDPLVTGAGNGLLGAGTSRLAEKLSRRARREDRQAQRLPLRDTRSPIPVSLIDIPEALVTLADGPRLDPDVRELLTAQVRQRHNSLRSCYEAWGLAANPAGAGRLTLQLTLRPDGRVEKPTATVDNAGLRLVTACVEKVAADWYLGAGLVDTPRRLSFPFHLRPRQEEVAFDIP